MKVILTRDVPNLGRSGEVKEVSDGHFRNFLMPKHWALPATTAALSKLQKEEGERQEKLKRDLEKLSALKNQIQNKTISIKVKDSGKKSLFAAIRESQVAEALNDKLKLNLDPKQILIKTPIKSLGEHTVEVKLAENIISKVTLKIESI
jgi:large subunit ribosomal protein L9